MSFHYSVFFVSKTSRLVEDRIGDTDLADCAAEICKRLDLLIINRL